MNRNLHSPTKLTEFARDFDSEPETFFSKFVNKLTNAYNNGYNTVNVPPGTTNIDVSPTHQQPSINPLEMSSQASSSSSLSPIQQLKEDGATANISGASDKSTSTTTTASDNISNDDSFCDKVNLSYSI